MKILKTETLASYRKFDVNSHVMQAELGRELRREYLAHRGSVVLIPVLDDGRIVLENVYRHSIDRVLCELPAGTRDAGESFLQTAARELTEETGYAAGKLTVLLNYFPAPGITDEDMAVVLCENLTAGPPRLEPDEEITVELLTLADALARIDAGRIVDGKTILALWKYAVLRATA